MNITIATTAPVKESLSEYQYLTFIVAKLVKATHTGMFEISGNEISLGQWANWDFDIVLATFILLTKKKVYIRYRNSIALSGKSTWNEVWKMTEHVDFGSIHIEIVNN